MDYPNFYESIEEADARLRGSVVMYAGRPVFIVGITGHVDGTFRVYYQDIPLKDNGMKTKSSPEYIAQCYHPSFNAMKEALDESMKDNPESGLKRVRINSPAFDRFRPFPLGMYNAGTTTYYVQRQPNRNMLQGLVASMLYITRVGTDTPQPHYNVSLKSEEFRQCVLADHPSAAECLTGLLDPANEDDAAAFHRDFALNKGPVGMLFLAYKTDVIGHLPKSDFSEIRLSAEFDYTKEVVDELFLFNDITII